MATIINVPDFDQDNKVLRFYSAFYYILRSENIIAPPRLHVTECSQAAGGTQLIHANYAYEDTNPEFAKIALDIYNAYNELERAALLQSLWDQPETRSLYMYAYNQLHPMSDMFREDAYRAQLHANDQSKWYDNSGFRRSRPAWFASHCADPFHFCNDFLYGSRGDFYAFL